MVHDEQVERLGLAFDPIRHLNAADEVASGRFMGAMVLTQRCGETGAHDIF